MTIDTERALVSVAHPWADPVDGATLREVVGASRPGKVEILEALVLTCSEHGELTDWEGLPMRSHLQWLARRHAEQAHDGDVDRDGWAG